jgi:hypothetical protein
MNLPDFRVVLADQLPPLLLQLLLLLADKLLHLPHLLARLLPPRAHLLLPLSR